MIEFFGGAGMSSAPLFSTFYLGKGKVMARVNWDNHIETIRQGLSEKRWATCEELAAWVANREPEWDSSDKPTAVYSWLAQQRRKYEQDARILALQKVQAAGLVGDEAEQALTYLLGRIDKASSVYPKLPKTATSGKRGRTAKIDSVASSQLDSACADNEFANFIAKMKEQSDKLES